MRQRLKQAENIEHPHKKHRSLPPSRASTPETHTSPDLINKYPPPPSHLPKPHHLPPFHSIAFRHHGSRTSVAHRKKPKISVLYPPISLLSPASESLPLSLQDFRKLDVSQAELWRAFGYLPFIRCLFLKMKRSRAEFGIH